MEPKATKCLMLGYARNHLSGTYRMYNPLTKKVLETRGLIFALTSILVHSLGWKLLCLLTASEKIFSTMTMTNMTLSVLPLFYQQKCPKQGGRVPNLQSVTLTKNTLQTIAPVTPVPLSMNPTRKKFLVKPNWWWRKYHGRREWWHHHEPRWR